MPTQFYVNPIAGKFDAVAPGYDATSPGSVPAADMVFNAFGPRYQGMVEAGTVPWSAFSGPHSVTPPGGASSAFYYSATINFVEAFTYAPVCLVSYQDPTTGDWSNAYLSGNAGASLENGFYYGTGTGAVGAFTATSTSLTIWLYIVVYSAGTWAAFSNAAYRVFGL